MIEIIPADKLLKMNLPNIEYLVDGIIPKGGIVYCFGPPASFKTNFLLYMSMKGAEGKSVFDFNVKKKFTTLWIDEENRKIGMKDKVMKIARGMDIKDEDLNDVTVWISEGFNILNKVSLSHLEDAIKKYKPDCIVIDSIAKVFPLSERNESDVRKIYTFLKPFIVKYGVTFVLIHHARKKSFMQMNRDMEDISGSREFAAMADSILMLDELKNGRYILKQVKNRYSQKVYAENFEVTGDDELMMIEYCGKVKDAYLAQAMKAKESILQWIDKEAIKEFKRKDAMEAMKALGYKVSNIDSALKILKTSGDFGDEYGIYKVVK